MSGGLRFNHHLRPAFAGQDQVFLLGEREQFILRGRLYRLLAPLLDGSRSPSDLVRALAGTAPPADVLAALAALRERGYLAEGEPPTSTPPEAAAFWRSLGIEPALADARLAATPVNVKATGSLSARPFVEALAGAGVRITGAAARVLFVLTEDYLSHDLDVHNRDAIVHGGPLWIPIKPTGASAWIGPLFRPGTGFCWACLAHRIRLNRPVDRFLERHAVARSAEGDQCGELLRLSLAPPVASIPAAASSAYHCAALIAARWILSGGEGPIDRSLIALDLAELSITEHLVTKRPQCSICGDPGISARRAGRPLLLEPRRKRFTAEGGHRAARPEEMIEGAETRLLSPITGIFSDIALAKGSDLSLRPVFACIFPVCPRADAPALSDFHQVAAGKGRSAAQARASAIGEAVERWSSQFQGDEPRILATLADLNDEAVHPRSLLNYSDAQYRARTAGRGGRDGVPEPFDPDIPIEWTPVWSLTHHRRRYVPTAYCYNNYPLAPASRVFPNDSNGNAAGSCLEEAIVQGFLELVERDAVALWWYSRSARPRVDLDSFSEPYFHELSEEYRANGFSLWALDVTTDLTIPTIVALAEGPGERLLAGFGCHFDARIAALRALTEVNQAFVSAPRPGADRRGLRSSGPSDYLSPDPDAEARTAGHFPSWRSDDLREDVFECTTRAARAGLEVLVLDQTRPDVGMPVVKVIVPGLRHFSPRFGPGRLYETPKRIGFRAENLREEDLNPRPIFW